MSSSVIQVHIIANAKILNICDAILDITSIFGAFWRDFCKIMQKLEDGAPNCIHLEVCWVLLCQSCLTLFSALLNRPGFRKKSSPKAHLLGEHPHTLWIWQTWSEVHTTSTSPNQVGSWNHAHRSCFCFIYLDLGPWSIRKFIHKWWYVLTGNK